MSQILSEGLLGRKVYYDYTTVTLDATGDGTKAVVLPSGFVSPPAVFVVPRLTESGTYSASSITVSGFNITVAGSDVVSQDITVLFIVHEQL